jgi:hypothetical protein
MLLLPMYVESGGGSTGCGSLSSYCATYGYTTDSRILEVYAFSDTPEDAWAYAYSKFKVNATVSGNYNVTVGLAVLYDGIDSYGNHGEIWVIIKLIDSSGNVIGQWEDRVAYLENDSQVSASVVVLYNLDAGYLNAGTYYIEVGVKSIADTSWYQIAGCVAHAHAIIDTAMLAPSS